MRRALILVALVGLVALAPATSPSQAKSDVVGVLLDKVGSGTAQACRLVLGVSTDVCILPTGDDVSPEAIAAYQASWTHRALTLQRALGDEEPLVNSDWVATHNSYNSASYYPTLSGLDNNQQLTITGQLELGVRNIELDLHWFPSLSVGLAMAPVVCHSQGPIGCTIEPALKERLLEIRHWLDAHPAEVIVVYLEDQLGTAPAYDAAASAIEEVLGDLVFRPPGGGGCEQSALGYSRAEIRAASAQVLFRSECENAAITPAWSNVVWSRGQQIQGSHDGSFRPYPDCDAHWSHDEVQAAYARHWEDSTFLTAATSGTAAPLDAATVHAMVQCGIDEVGLDQLVPSDPRLAAYVWSWAPNEPAVTAPGTCAAAGPDGRFVAWPCGTPLRAACIDPQTGAWSLTPNPVSQKDGDSACAAAAPGSLFAVPRTGYSASRLRDAMTAAGVDRVWLRYAVDSAGFWTS